MKTSLLLPCLALFLFVSCSSESSKNFISVNGHSVLVCNMAEVKDTLDFPLSELLESCEMVRLETTEQAFFDRARFTDVSDNYILIKSAAMLPVKLFDKSGTFLREIGAIGRGPGEYTSLYGIQLDEAHDRIYLTPFARANKIIVYNLLGEQQEDIPLAYQSGKVRTFIKDGKLTALCMPFPKDEVVAFQQELDGSLIQKAAPEKHLFAMDFNSEIFASFNSGRFDFHNTMCDTLYEYDPGVNQIIPKVCLNKPEGEQIYASLFSTPKHYFAWVGKDARLLIDAKTGEAHYVRVINDFFGNLRCDLWGGFNGTFANVIPAIDIKDQVAKALKNDKLSEKDRALLSKMDREIKEDDSPVLFFGTFK